MKILISGGTGFIGKALIKNFIQTGCQFVVLTRNKVGKVDSNSIKYVEWDARSSESIIPYIKDINAVINLAGDNIGDGYWTKAKKERIINSRVQAGNALSRAIIDSGNKPDVFIQASGVGYYGSSLEETFDEFSPIGKGFQADVVHKWENSSEVLDSAGIRRVIIRMGIVLDAKSGALPLMVLPFKMFVGGPLGSGRQYVSWIHLQDNVRAIDFVMRNNKLSGVVNLTAPTSYTNKDFGKIIGKVLRRPYWFQVPAFGLKLVLGEKSELVFEGQNVYPGKLMEHGFQFIYPELESALINIYYK
ncbi:MAG: TIGR01777 family protein [Chloroflexi bacterium HGW-Chloroflexi-3]|nr:MAG: TIGR01777 family protein [Chloroflexi bacterium HGW-Chloroflexi-3]